MLELIMASSLLRPLGQRQQQTTVVDLVTVDNHMDTVVKWVSSVAVRALAHCTEDQGSEPTPEPMVGRSLTVHPAANGDAVEALGR